MRRGRRRHNHGVVGSPSPDDIKLESGRMGVVLLARLVDMKESPRQARSLNRWEKTIKHPEPSSGVRRPVLVTGRSL